MKHILDCSEQELLSFIINKSYKGHGVRIKPITDMVANINIDFSESEKMIIPQDIKIERNLHVLFQMFNGFEVDLGLIMQEMVYDDEALNCFISERLKYFSSYLGSLNAP